jgi:hypothetical protein
MWRSSGKTRLGHANCRKKAHLCVRNHVLLCHVYQEGKLIYELVIENILPKSIYLHPRVSSFPCATLNRIKKPSMRMPYDMNIPSEVLFDFHSGLDPALEETLETANRRDGPSTR